MTWLCCWSTVAVLDQTILLHKWYTVPPLSPFLPLLLKIQNSLSHSQVLILKHQPPEESTDDHRCCHDKCPCQLWKHRKASHRLAVKLRSTMHTAERRSSTFIDLGFSLFRNFRWLVQANKWNPAPFHLLNVAPRTRPHARIPQIRPPAIAACSSADGEIR